MKLFNSRRISYTPDSAAKQVPVRSQPQYVPVNFRTISVMAVVVALSNVLTLAVVRPTGEALEEIVERPVLYLLDKASTHVADPKAFERKVREVSQNLGVAPEWLMAVMYSESRFDAAVSNHRGSGAVGLIQWMPTTAREFGLTTAQLKAMDHIEQLDYVYAYLDRIRRQYGAFENLTDLYLAILWPRALSGDYCYTLYSSPSKAYRQNRGLDENKDGRVTVSDVDKRMQRVFPTAYHAPITMGS